MESCSFGFVCYPILFCCRRVSPLARRVEALDNNIVWSPKLFALARFLSLLEVFGIPCLTATLNSLLNIPGAEIISWLESPDSKIIVRFAVPRRDLSDTNSILGTIGY
jgi:hypothetical protein